MDTYYKDYNDNDFSKMLEKYEFQEKSKKQYLYQQPRQLLLRNFISKNTIYDNILLFHDLGSGKCHAKDTKILMFDGTIKKVQDIKIGELLMGDDSKPRKVLSLARGEDSMYDIIPVKGKKYRVNKEHILCLKYSKKPCILNADSVSEQGNYTVKWFDINNVITYNKNFKIKKDAEEFLKIKEDEYKKHQNIIEINIKEYLKLTNTIKSQLKGYKVPVNFNEKEVFDPYMIGYWISSRIRSGSLCSQLDRMKSQLIKQKIFNKEKFEKFKTYMSKENMSISKAHCIPHIYKCNSRENRLKLLAGLIDSDGSYDKKVEKQTYFFEFSQSLKYEQIIDDIIYLCRSLGFACYKNKKKTSCTHLGISLTWRISISGENIKNIPVLCLRKKASPRKQKKDVLVTNIKVKYIKKDKYYGFTLDGNCRYLLGDFTVTHNTCSAITIAEGFKEYVSNMGKKIVVLVKNKNIENNFRQEMLSECTRNSYINNNQRELINNISLEERKLFLNKINRKINKQYNFITYGTFVNQILGAKDYEKNFKGENLKQKVNEKGEKIRKVPSRQLDFNNTVIIIDEVHNITNNDVYIALKKVLEKSYNYRLVLLTATPIYDNPKEIIEITNILNMNRLKLPIRNKLFNDYIDNNGINHGPLMIKPDSKNINTELIKGGIIRITENGKKILSNALIGKVSYLKADTSTFPRKIDIGEPLIKNKKGTMNVVYCEMSDFQTNIYIKSLSLDTNIDYNKKNITEIISNIQSIENETGKGGSSRTDSLFKNSSDASTFVYPIGLYGKEGFESIFIKIGNSFKLKDEIKDNNPFKGDNLKKYSMKLFTLLENVKKSKGNTFIYSNYVNFGGTELVKQLLLQNGYKSYSSGNENGKSFILFDDSVPIEIREQQKKIFNSKENAKGNLIKIIIGSPIISEGITLKNIRQIHILEPSWNMSKINQIIGRGIRYKSHYDLSEKERTVEIYKYCSIKKSKNISSKLFIDEQKYILSEEKDRSNKEIERILKQISFDCNLNSSNSNSNLISGSAECDYIDCNYKCNIKQKNPFAVDKDTYNAYIEFFDSFDIEFNINKIKELFKIYFIWNTEDIIEYIKKKSNSKISNESINIALSNLIDNKLLLVDKYNRSGFLIRKDDYYIFNAENIDINSSIYNKIFNFKEYNNKYTLNEFAKIENIKVNEMDIKETKKEKKKKEIKEYILTQAQEEENEKIKTTKYPTNSNYNIYGSFIKYNTTTKKYEDDGNLKIIIENGDDENDKRKVKKGMTISSFDKNINPKKPISLIQLTKILNISTTKAKEYLKSLDIKELEELGKGQLQKIISLELYNKKRILHPPSDTDIKERL